MRLSTISVPPAWVPRRARHRCPQSIAVRSVTLPPGRAGWQQVQCESGPTNDRDDRGRGIGMFRRDTFAISRYNDVDFALHGISDEIADQLFAAGRKTSLEDCVAARCNGSRLLMNSRSWNALHAGTVVDRGALKEE